MPDPHPSPAPAAAVPSSRRWWLVALVVLGFAVRLGLSSVSYGSDDAWVWHCHARALNELGFREPFVTQQVEFNPLNHPPLPLLYAGLCDQWAGEKYGRFQVYFRLPIILLDGVAAVVLYRVWQRRARLGWAAAAIWALSPLAILSGAYHCNTDDAVATLTLLAVALLAGRRPVWAGLALALAANIKIVPVLMIPALAAACADRRAVLRFAAGLSAGLVPFAWGFHTGGWPFVYGVFGYKGFAGQWGVGAFLWWGQMVPAVSGQSNWIWVNYVAQGRWAVLAMSLALGAAAWLRRGRWDAFQLAALWTAGFLFIAPSFALQYLIYPLPLMLGTDLRRGTLYGLLAGLMALIVYATYLTHWWPVQSQFRPGLPTSAMVVGVAAWALLGWFVVDTLVRPKRVTDPAP